MLAEESGTLSADMLATDIGKKNSEGYTGRLGNLCSSGERLIRSGRCVIDFDQKLMF